MKTVKEVSELTGISVRTLHYYDEIGLLKPTGKSEAGYRLYDDGALETLQQILFFREFDIPLKTIKDIMENPSLEKNQILSMQRRMLVKKKERMERLIAGIDEILKGDGQMEFDVFSKTELEEISDAMIEHMSEEQKAVFASQYGSMEQWRRSFLEKGVTKEVQEIRELIGQYAFAAKQMFRLTEEKETVPRIGEVYRTNRELQKTQDTIYGEGTMEFFGRAIEAYYGEG